MIAIKKPGKTPLFMDTGIFSKMRAGLKKFYNQPQAKRRQQKPPYIPLPASVLEKIRTQLQKEFNGKCAYCESTITVSYQGDFDHFRPKSSARGFSEEFALDHYWPFAFNWDNMYLCCTVCNRYKLNWFPVKGSRGDLKLNLSQIRKAEKPLLIDPCYDNPEEHFQYREYGKIVGINERAKTTIDTLKLNRKELVENRGTVAEELAGIELKLKNILAKGTTGKALSIADKRVIEEMEVRVYHATMENSAAPFLGILRFFLEKIFRENSALVHFLLKHDESGVFGRYVKQKDITTLKIKAARVARVSETKQPVKNVFLRLSIASIEIENFKSIEKLTIQFPQSHNRKEPWLMLLGENGVGKSSFLQAVTLALMGENYRKKIDIVPTDILRNGTARGFVKINQVDGTPIELHFTSKNIENSVRDSPTYLLAYGSTRLFPSKRIKPELNKGRIRAKNMFSADTALFADNWLIALKEKNPEKFDYAARALKSLLAKEIEDPNINLFIKKDEVWVQYSDPKRLPDKLRSLSDGYKSIIALACDMMQALMEGNSTMEVAEGIVLLDEIGTHLHPRWKMRVVNSFRAAFPKLQFIVTTHDPLCLKGLFAGEVAVFDKDSTGKIFAICDMPDPREFRADQLLSSRFFGLNSTIDEALEKEFDEYYSLLGRKDALTKKDQSRLAELTEILKGKQHLGNSLREELAYYAVDQLLAREKMQEAQTPVPQLKEQTVNLLQDLWNKTTDEQQKIIKV